MRDFPHTDKVALGALKRAVQSAWPGPPRHRYFHELGATKLACLWVLEHVDAFKEV